MENNNKSVSFTTSQGKLIQYKEQSDLAFRLLIKSQIQDVPLDLDILLSYSLSPVPHSLGTADGFFAKTNKAAMLHYLIRDNDKDVPFPKDAMYIQDGNALFHTLTNLPPTFGGICLHMLDLMTSKSNFVFSTDSYHPDSIKTQERLRRGCGEQFLLSGPATRKPKDFKIFLTNNENKNQFCEIIKEVWGSSSAASRLEKTSTSILIVKGRAYKIKSENGQVSRIEIPELLSNQEETDTRVVLYINHAKDLGFKSTIVRTPDTDIFFILLFHAHNMQQIKIYVDIGVGKTRKMINVSDMAFELGREWCTVLLGFYVFTGEDCTSAFKGKGKVNPLKKLMQTPKFHKAFCELGENWIVNDNIYREIEAFTCIMYGYKKETSINRVRSKMLKNMVGEDQNLDKTSKIDLARLPPCQDSLIQHINRVNHRLSCFKKASIPTYEKPKPYEKDQGWIIDDETGMIEPKWSNGPILQQSLIDLLATSIKESDEEEDEDVEMDADEIDDDEDDDNNEHF